jgi:phenylacetate-CoA ligase
MNPRSDPVEATAEPSAADFLPREQLRQVQLARLQAIVERAHRHVRLFRERMETRGLGPDSVRSLEDIARLPFSEKSDLRDAYPFGLFASPMAEIVRLHASSGTTWRTGRR